MSTNEYFLYGGDMSLYTGKARSYLRKKGVRFETRPTSHPGYARAAAEIGRGFMPILETAAGEFVQDTTEIIDFIESREDRNFKLRFREYSEELGRVSQPEAAWPG